MCRMQPESRHTPTILTRRTPDTLCVPHLPAAVLPARAAAAVYARGDRIAIFSGNGANAA